MAVGTRIASKDVIGKVLLVPVDSVGLLVITKDKLAVLNFRDLLLNLLLAWVEAIEGVLDLLVNGIFVLTLKPLSTTDYTHGDLLIEGLSEVLPRSSL